MGDMSPSRVAIILMAHGSPNTLDDVEPFLSHIMKERKPSPEVMAEIRERYRLIGGKSPLLEITQQQAKALEDLLNAGEVQFKVYIGMRHWDPFIKDTVQEIIADGAECLIALSLAPQNSKLSVGAYIETLKQALSEAGSRLPMTAVQSWCDQPLLLDAFGEQLKEALDTYSEEVRSSVQILFTAHSLPEYILKEGDPYPDEVVATVTGVSERPALSLSKQPWRFAYQSQGLRPGKWLGPSVEEVIHEMAEKKEKHLLVVPIGFVSDHVEILYDVDILYKEIAAKAGIELRRPQSLNTHPLFIRSLAEVVLSNLSPSFVSDR
ncbi:MAG: ferrochelatase [Nitrospiria bacterium]